MNLAVLPSSDEKFRCARLSKILKRVNKLLRHPIANNVPVIPSRNRVRLDHHILL
jgi:hypothetical protein